MDERLKDALFSAGEMLAEAVRAGLSAHGLPSEVRVQVHDGRVVVGSASPIVRDAEVGTRGVAPSGLLEGIGREVAPQVAGILAHALRNPTR